MKVDLFLGSDIGIWAISNTPKEFVNLVFSLDEKIKEYCRINNYNLSYLDSNFKNSNFGISVHYPKIIPNAIINKYKSIYNIHPGALPYGKGMYPAFWALYKNEPAGATIHEIDGDLDTGPIVEQKIVNYDKNTSGKKLHQLIRKEERLLYRKYLEEIINEREIVSYPQTGKGSYYSKEDFLKLKEIPKQVWNRQP